MIQIIRDGIISLISMSDSGNTIDYRLPNITDSSFPLICSYSLQLNEMLQEMFKTNFNSVDQVWELNN